MHKSRHQDNVKIFFLALQFFRELLWRLVIEHRCFAPYHKVSYRVLKRHELGVSEIVFLEAKNGKIYIEIDWCKNCIKRSDDKQKQKNNHMGIITPTASIEQAKWYCLSQCNIQTLKDVR